MDLNIKKVLGDFDFWNSWTEITPIEQKAIEAVVKARALIVASIPAEELVAIYIKGSFVRREMNENSDVDMVPIVKTTDFEGQVFNVNDEDINPVMVVPLSIEEFEKNELMTETSKPVDLRAKPDRMLRMIKECRLIFGQELDASKYPMRSDAQAYEDEKEIINIGYIPLYLQGSIKFDPLLKEFFWMTEMELLSKGIQVPHTFVGIAKAAPLEHLIHEALKLREMGVLDKNTELEFVDKLRTKLKV